MKPLLISDVNEGIPTADSPTEGQVGKETASGAGRRRWLIGVKLLPMPSLFTSPDAPPTLCSLLFASEDNLYGLLQQAVLPTGTCIQQWGALARYQRWGAPFLLPCVVTSSCLDPAGRAQLLPRWPFLCFSPGLCSAPSITMSRAPHFLAL